jgi:hypothetical protein
MDVRAPLVGYYFAYLFLYVLLVGPINYAFLRYKRRLEWAWVTIPAAVVLFSFGTVVAARIMRGGDSIVASVGVEQYFQREGVGYRRADVVVVPSGKGSYRIAFPDGAGSFPLGNFAGGDSEPYALDQTEFAPAIVASMNTWDVRTFHTLALATDGPPARVRLTPGSAEVTNTSADRLRGAVAITREGLYFVGDVEPGATASADAPEYLQSSFEPWYSGRLGDFAEGRRLATGYLTLGGGGWATAPDTPSVELLNYNRTLDKVMLADLRQPLLVAIRDGGSGAAEFEVGARERGLSLVVVVLEEGVR